MQLRNTEILLKTLCMPNLISTIGKLYFFNAIKIECFSQTFVSDILIAINPNKEIGSYSQEIIRNYYCDSLKLLPPHIFAMGKLLERSRCGFKSCTFQNVCMYFNFNVIVSTADKVAKNLRVTKNHQSIIIGGESGSGKTEATKHLLKFLYSSDMKLGTDVLKTNVVLEAFGNCRMKENPNSSRFIKVVQVRK